MTVESGTKGWLSCQRWATQGVPGLPGGGDREKNMATGQSCRVLVIKGNWCSREAFLAQKPGRNGFVTLYTPDSLLSH